MAEQEPDNPTDLPARAPDAVALARRLGPLLLAATVLKTVSFAYQKDWLTLKEPAAGGHEPLASPGDETLR